MPATKLQYDKVKGHHTCRLHSLDWVLEALGVVDFLLSVPGPDWVLETLVVAFFLVDISFSVTEKCTYYTDAQKEREKERQSNTTQHKT